ncbi:putative disease resistance protein RGA4 [Punica granatum]|uniref:Disease resistance protein RGA4 n=1 Tax=Punica granatum TaxID=22663 RepID=A0A6P8BSV8_PUNGR|nr:putative disease resistance protein RGA4 [Punica granatum]XP_031372811.1 putative disease resistance protein RGA4 [Punica granatum]
MADLILGSIVDSIAGHLVSLIAQEIGLTCGVKRELQKLQGTVSAIAAMLREAEKRRIEAEDVKDWLQKLKVVVYDADDLLDDFSTEALRRQRVVGGVKRVLNEVRIFLSSSNQLVYASMMAHRVKEIREKIDAIKSDRSDFKVEGNDGNNTLGNLVENQPRPETHPYKRERYVVGRDEDIKEVIEFLLNPDFEENVSILPIVGIGGLGKTTLARQVFNNDSIKEYFSVKLWVCVSTNFDAEEIMRKIVRESTPGKEDLKGAELAKKLGEELDGKKFLLVLDDVWNDNRSKWLDLEGSLMNGAKGSKILVTTRHLSVAKAMTPTTCHELRGLPEDQSLDLLMRMAGKQEYEWKTHNLEEIAKEILKKCAGVPLAIRTIGRLLVSLGNTEEVWLSFNNNELSRIDQDEGDIMPSLRLSYDFLPSHLKQCFAYCCLFPKDYELDPSELIHLWMAQGFIKPLGNRKTQLEEVSHDYFMELLSRSFFQDIEEDLDGNIWRCKMHDLMHELAQSVARDNCFTIDSSHEKKLPEGARHVSTDDLDVLKSRFEKDRRIRSLLFTNERNFTNIYLDVSCFRILRALRIREACLNEISGSIGKLKHMRSLDLSGNAFQYLPNSISGLCNLETLNLGDCKRLKRLPRGLTKLVNLRQLDVSGCDELTHMPRGIGKLTNLQMLGEFKVGKDSIRDAAAGLNELSKLTGLRKELTIRHLERSVPSGLEASFPIEKLALQSLNLIWDPEKATEADAEVLERLRPHPDLKKLRIFGYSGVQPSSWISQLHKLVEISFYSCDNCVRLPPLDQLPSLKRIYLLELRNLQWIELSESESGTPQSNSFPSLQFIQAGDLPKFRGWERRSSSRIEQEEEAIQEEVDEDDDDDSLLMLPVFSDKVWVITYGCPTFSYMHGQELHLTETSTRIIKQLLRNVTIRHASASSSSSSRITSISLSSISLLALTRLTISQVENFEHLPVEFLQSLPSLQSLAISDCPRLKALPVRAILRYLTALESLEISYCRELDLSTGESGYQEDMPEGPACKLRELEFVSIEKMETLPWWIQHLTNLESLKIGSCEDLKAFPEWFPQLTSLKRLEISNCGEELRRRCRRDIGEDWPNISHIPDINVWPPEKI